MQLCFIIIFFKLCSARGLNAAIEDFIAGKRPSPEQCNQFVRQAVLDTEKLVKKISLQNFSLPHSVVIRRCLLFTHTRYVYPERIEWYIEGQASLQLFDPALRPLPPPPSRQQVASFSQSSWTTDRRGGREGVSWSWIMWPQESLALYTEFNNLCHYYTNLQANCWHNCNRKAYCWRDVAVRTEHVYNTISAVTAPSLGRKVSLSFSHVLKLLRSVRKDLGIALGKWTWSMITFPPFDSRQICKFQCCEIARTLSAEGY